MMEPTWAMHKGSIPANTAMIELTIRITYNGSTLPKSVLKGYVGQLGLDNFAKTCTIKQTDHDRWNRQTLSKINKKLVSSQSVKHV